MQPNRTTSLKRNQAVTSSLNEGPTTARRTRSRSRSKGGAVERAGGSNWLDYSSTGSEDGDSEDSEEDEKKSLPPGQWRSRQGTHTLIFRRANSLTLTDQAGPAERPLVSYVTNEWQSSASKKYMPASSAKNTYTPEKEKREHYQARRSSQTRRRDSSPAFFNWNDCGPRSWGNWLLSAMTVRVLAGWTVVFAILYFSSWWFGGAAERLAQSEALSTSARLKLAGSKPRGPLGRARTWFGSQVATQLDGITQVGNLSDTGWTWENGKRLVVVGDVHGCADELRALIIKLAIKDTEDHIIFTGDMVAKGPDSPGVIDIAIARKASCVRGNHEDKLLLTRRDAAAPSWAVYHSDTPETSSGRPRTGQHAHSALAGLAKTLTP